MEQKLIAFWQHDHYPFFQGGTVDEFGCHGTVQVVEYGKESFFRPFNILTEEEGRPIMEALITLTVEKGTLAEIERLLPSRFVGALEAYNEIYRQEKAKFN